MSKYLLTMIMCFACVASLRPSGGKAEELQVLENGRLRLSFSQKTGTLVALENRLTEEKLDVEEAERRLADPAEKPIPYEQARKEKSVAKRQMTARDLLESGLVGIWEDRTDIGDSLSFARKLRERAQRRSGK